MRKGVVVGSPKRRRGGRAAQLDVQPLTPTLSPVYGGEGEERAL